MSKIERHLVSDHKGVYPLVKYHHIYPYTTYRCKQMNKHILVYRTFARNNSIMIQECV